MNLLKKNFLIIGCQKAALREFKKSLKILGANKVILLDQNFFLKSTTKNKLNVNFEKLLKYKNQYEIIIGTSEFFLESNIANFLDKNNINYYCYIDSIISLKERFQYFIKIPANLITLNKVIIKQLKIEFKKKISLKNINNLNMPYQRSLKERYFMLNRKNESILYLTSDIGINTEIKLIKSLHKNEGFIKKLYIKIHPREDIIKWQKKFIDKKNIEISINKDFYKNKKIKRVFAVSTTAMINYKFAGFDVYYIKHKILIKSPMMKIINFFKIKKYTNKI